MTDVEQFIRSIREHYQPKRLHDTLVLWKLLWHMLLEPRTGKIIRWIDEKGTFQSVSPHMLAHLWGMCTTNDQMTYDKLSRAFRYYYRDGPIEKVQHQRLQYKVRPEWILNHTGCEVSRVYFKSQETL